MQYSCCVGTRTVNKVPECVLQTIRSGEPALAAEEGACGVAEFPGLRAWGHAAGTALGAAGGWELVRCEHKHRRFSQLQG